MESPWIQLRQRLLRHVDSLYSNYWRGLAWVCITHPPHLYLILEKRMHILIFRFRVLKNSMDATHVNRGPLEDYQQQVAIFYITFFVVFPFFFVNIFVALIIITFQKQGENELIDLELDKNQVIISVFFK